MKKRVRILGIETSCDESGLALLDASRDRFGNLRMSLLHNFLHSQIATHRKTGGVVPEVAAREHAIRLPLLLAQLEKHIPLAKLNASIDAIAVTSGPGLVTSLVTGVEVARTISYLWKKPLVPVNHLEGHIYANLLPRGEGTTSTNPGSSATHFTFPLLALLVSGGHTELILMRRHLSYIVLGSTRDDAAGEAFDKTAKLLGLPYPGGPALSRLAQQGKPIVKLPRPMLDKKYDLDFSFSGLKTAAAMQIEKGGVRKADMAASIETAIIETLVEKTCRAAEQYAPKTIVLAGGVAANKTLQRRLAEELAARAPKATLLTPAIEFATDNGAMIAAAGAVRFLLNKKRPLVIDPHLPL